MKAYVHSKDACNMWNTEEKNPW